jgi:uncharacterized protein (TIGR00369 family)
VTEPTRAPYPPPGHFLRHLRLAIEASEREVVATMPVLPDLCDAVGAVRLGPVAAFVDFAAGGLASAAAAPDWIVTHDLEIHLLGDAGSGVLHARARHLRAARNHFVSETEVSDDEGNAIAHVFITYTRLHGSGADRPRQPAPPGRRNLAEAVEAPRIPIDDFLGFEVNAGAGTLRFPHLAVLRNSTGAIQGGVIATAFESLGAAVATRDLGIPCRTTDLHLYYLDQGRNPPFEARAVALRRGPRGMHLRFELIEAARPERPLAVGTGSVMGHQS